MGKTTLIKHLIGRDYPLSRIDPAPSTDGFYAVLGGEREQVILGDVAVVRPELPFHGLSMFGDAFLSKFYGVTVPSPLLDCLSIVDSPGVLSSRSNRDYDFMGAFEWFARQSDLILLMFDSSKLDASDELTEAIRKLQPFEDKVLCVLNKADGIEMGTEALLKVYGALMWSLVSR